MEPPVDHVLNDEMFDDQHLADPAAPRTLQDELSAGCSYRARTPSTVAAQLYARTKPGSPRTRKPSGLQPLEGVPATYQFLPGHGYVMKKPEAIFAEMQTRDRLGDIIEAYKVAHLPKAEEKVYEVEPEPEDSSSSEEDMEVNRVAKSIIKFKVKRMANRMAKTFHDRPPTDEEMMDVAAAMLQVRMGPRLHLTLDPRSCFACFLTARICRRGGVGKSTGKFARGM